MIEQLLMFSCLTFTGPRLGNHRGLPSGHASAHVYEGEEEGERRRGSNKEGKLRSTGGSQIKSPSIIITCSTRSSPQKSFSIPVATTCNACLKDLNDENGSLDDGIERKSTSTLLSRVIEKDEKKLFCRKLYLRIYFFNSFTLQHFSKREVYSLNRFSLKLKKKKL